jgi:uncharacterized membrane protein
MVGGFLLAGPFVVTEEVWDLAGNMSLLQTLATVSVVFGIGYATLYKADTKRNQEGEQNIAGVPLRFLSLMAVSFGSAAILAVLFDAPGTFVQSADTNWEMVLITCKAVSLSSVFSVVGAATADTLFSR